MKGADCNYGFLIYHSWFEEGQKNDSVYDTFEEYLDNLEKCGLHASVSPLHDKDVYEKSDKPVRDGKAVEGEIKKPHWHVLVWSENMTVESMLKKLVPFGIKHIVRMFDNQQAVEYLTHDSKRSTSKVHYSKDDVINLNGGCKLENNSDPNADFEHSVSSLRQILQFADDNAIFNFDDLCYGFMLTGSDELLKYFIGASYNEVSLIRGFINSVKRKREFEDCIGRYCRNGFVRGDFPNEDV